MPEEPVSQDVAHVLPAAEEALAASSAGADPPAKSAETGNVPSSLPVHSGRFVRRPINANPNSARRRWLVSGFGLALLAGCLFGLLHSGSLPSWNWLGSERSAVDGSVWVVIDPGHGGADFGAMAQGVVEKDLNLDVGLRVAAALRARGAKVKLTREDDRFISLEGRVRLANALPKAVFVSIHFNDDPEAIHAPTRASGIETYYSETRMINRSSKWMLASLFKGSGAANAMNDPAQLRETVRQSQTLADHIQGALIASTSAANRGIKERALYVTRRVQWPAVLVEGGFVSHPTEARRLDDPVYRQQLADSIVSGIVGYLDAASNRSAFAPPVLASAKH